jgi:1-acyl-sn-glycerol-3-phosphate acyltransferase
MASIDSIGSTLLYFICCHILGFLVVLSNVLFVFGSIIYPRTIGLFFALPYLTYMLATKAELKGGSPWPWFSENFFMFKVLRKGLAIDFVDFPKDASEKQYFYACHPHGVYSDFRVLIDGMFSARGAPIKSLAATVLFRLPFIREVALWTGCVDARRSVAERCLKGGESLLVLPGGEAEQILTKYGREIVYLKKRKGFIKLAIRQGVPVVPIYIFGVSDYYYTSDFLLGPRMWLMKNCQVCLPLSAGLGYSPFCPLMKQTSLVFGEPLQFEKCEDPTPEQLDKAHGEFIHALVKLFDKHKERLGYGDRELEIV